MERLYKLIPYAFALATAATGFSYTNNNQCGCEPAPKCDPCQPCKPAPVCDPCDPCDPCEPCEVCEPCPWQGYYACDLNAGYNAPGRIDICGEWDFFVKADYILWQPRAEGIELGTYGYVSGGETAKVVNQSFDYKSGFQVGIGGSSEDDNWTMGLNYTWLRATNKKSTSGEHFHPSLCVHGSAEFTAAEQTWKSRFDILDLDWGRSYYMGKAVIFKPFIGARAYWIGQKLHQAFDDAATLALELESATLANSHGKSTSWAIGTRAGIQTNWILDEGFRVFGNAAASLAYQKVKTTFSEASLTETFASYHDSVGQITPNAELELGLGWGTYIDENRWHLDLGLSYMFQVFGNQNAIRGLSAKAADINGGDVPHDSSKGELMLHGLTFSAKLDF